MTHKQRLIALVEAAIGHAGGRSALAAQLRITGNAVTEWRKGRTAPDAYHLMQLQDLVKKAACVLIALGDLTQAPDLGAIGMHSGLGQRDNFTLYTLCIFRRLAAWLWPKATPPLQAA